MADNYGYAPSRDFEPALQAAIARMRSGQARQRGALAEATRNVRTSGVRFIPQETLERGFADAEAGLYGDFALNQAQETIADRRRQEDFQFAREALQRQADSQKTLARRMLQGQLIGSGINLGYDALKSFYKPGI